MTKVTLLRARVIVMCVMVFFGVFSITLGILTTLAIASSTLNLLNNILSLVYLAVCIPWSMYHVIRMHSLVEEMNGSKVSIMLHRKNMLLAGMNVTLLVMVIALLVYTFTGAKGKRWEYYGNITTLSLHCFCTT